MTNFKVGDRIKCIKSHASALSIINVGDEGVVLQIDPYGMLDTLEVLWDKLVRKSITTINAVVCLNTAPTETEIKHTIGGEKNIFEQLNIYDKETQERIWYNTFGSKYKVKGE